MTRSTHTRAERAAWAVARLEEELGDALVPLQYRTGLELLWALVLEEGATATQANRALSRLSRLCTNAASVVALGPRRVAALLQPLPDASAKARRLVRACGALMRRHQGHVPSAKLALARVPGVGPQISARFVMHLAHRSIAPDAAVLRVTARLDLWRATQGAPERQLAKGLPASALLRAHGLLTAHAERTCLPKAPACKRCVLASGCPKKGVPAKTARQNKRPAKAPKRAPARRKKKWFYWF
jgi:endonuclease-3